MPVVVTIVVTIVVTSLLLCRLSRCTLIVGGYMDTVSTSGFYFLRKGYKGYVIFVFLITLLLDGYKKTVASGYRLCALISIQNLHVSTSYSLVSTVSTVSTTHNIPQVFAELTRCTVY